jgi:sirohydrochlorin ferrochelatase
MDARATLLIAAHGTQSLVGAATVGALADLVRGSRPDVRVELCFLDILAPSIGEALMELAGPIVLVPAILSTGYHVRGDIPAAVGDRRDVVVTAHLGPDPLLSVALADRLTAARGAHPAGPIALVAAGSSDPAARQDLEVAAADLAQLLDVPVYAATVTDPDLDLSGFQVATYLLAEGTFADIIASLARAAASPVVSVPLGPHPAVARLILDRYDSGLVALNGGAEPSSGMLGR